jgi:hypothetical protein
MKMIAEIMDVPGRPPHEKVYLFSLLQQLS